MTRIMRWCVIIALSLPATALARDAASADTVRARAAGHYDGADYIEDFEKGYGEWSAHGEWGVGHPTTGPDSGYKSAFCVATNLHGNYANNALDSLISSPLRLSSGSYLSFMEWVDLTSQYLGNGVYSHDYCNVSISLDDGRSWMTLLSYTETSIAARSWSGRSVSLSNYAGDLVRIAFIFRSDGANNALGWYIDDIVVSNVGIWAPTHPDPRKSYYYPVLRAEFARTADTYVYKLDHAQTTQPAWPPPTGNPLYGSFNPTGDPAKLNIAFPQPGTWYLHVRPRFEPDSLGRTMHLEVRYADAVTAYSSSHNEVTWNPSTTVRVNWTPLIGVSRVRYLVDRDSSTVLYSGMGTDTSATTFDVSGAPTGAVFLHVAGLDELGVTGPTTTAKINVGSPPPPPVLDSLRIAVDDINPAKGTTTTARAKEYWNTGPVDPATGVTWRSSATSVATIAADGTITAAGIGTTSITATKSGKTSNAIAVSVGPAVPSGLRIVSSSQVIRDSTIQLVAIHDLTDGGTAVATNTVKWTSRDTSVAKVDSTGRVRGVAVGTTWIDAEDAAGRKAASGMTVVLPNLPPVWLPINGKPTTIDRKTTFTIAATDPNGDPILYRAVSLPYRATFDTTTRVFTWTRGATQLPDAVVIFRAVDPSGLGVNLTVALHAESTNQPPTVEFAQTIGDTVSWDASLAIRVLDSENDLASVHLWYSLDGTAWHRAHSSGDTAYGATTRIAAMSWHSGTDLASRALARNVRLRVRAADPDTGLPIERAVTVLNLPCDWDRDGKIGLADFSTLRTAWVNRDTTRNIGPYAAISGESFPSVRVTQDRKIDFEDIMAWGMFWDWAAGKGRVKTAARIAARPASEPGDAPVTLVPTNNGTAISIGLAGRTAHVMALAIRLPARTIALARLERGPFVGSEGWWFARIDTVAGVIEVWLAPDGSGSGEISRLLLPPGWDGVSIGVGYEIIAAPGAASESGAFVRDVRSMPLPTAWAMSVAPNPFNPSTTIRFEVPAAERVRIAVYDVLGREVAVLVDEMKEPGRNEATWTGRDAAGRQVASGTYVVRLSAGQVRMTERVTLAR